MTQSKKKKTKTRQKRWLIQDIPKKYLESVSPRGRTYDLAAAKLVMELQLGEVQQNGRNFKITVTFRKLQTRQTNTTTVKVVKCESQRAIIFNRGAHSARGDQNFVTVLLGY